jgi:hypothetical protein
VNGPSEQEMTDRHSDQQHDRREQGELDRSRLNHAAILHPAGDESVESWSGSRPPRRARSTLQRFLAQLSLRR